MTSPTSGGIRLSVSPGTTNKGVFIVRVDGSVDTLTAEELDHVIGALVRQRRTQLVIDLAGTHYVSSAGWGIFISRLREVREGGGDLKLARMTDSVRDVYDLLELQSVLHHFERLDTAEAEFNGSTALTASGSTALTASGSTALTASGSTAPIASEGRRTQSSATPNAVREKTDLPCSSPSTLDDALRHLVVEDPFYSLGELQKRLAEIGPFKIGRWGIWWALRGLGLGFRHQRFRYYRRQMHGPTALR
jgi:anti-sigma B factor antagonist